MKFRSIGNWGDLLKNSIWSVIGALISRGLLFIAWIVIGRILGSESYGQFGIIRNTILMFATFSGFSLGLTATKYISEFLKRDKLVINNVVNTTYFFGTIMGGIITLVFFFLAPYLSYSLNAKELVVDFRISSLIIFFSAFNGVQIGILQGFQKFKQIATVNIIQAIISFPLYIFGALYFNVTGSVIAFLISYILICVHSSFYVKRLLINQNIKFSWRYVKNGMTLLLSFSLPAFLAGLMVTPVRWICDAILVNSAGFNSMGVFTAALTFNLIIMVSASMISAPFLTVLASNKHNESKSVTIERVNLLVPWYLSILISLPLLYFYEFGYWLFGESFNFTEFKSAFIIVLFFTIVVMFKEGLTRINAVHNLQWWSLFSNFIWGAVLLTYSYFHTNLNATSLALGYTIAYIINILVLFPIYKKRKLIPNKSILTVDTAVIWLILIASTIISFIGIENLYHRIIMFVACFGIIVLLIYKKILFLKKKINEYN